MTIDTKAYEGDIVRTFTVPGTWVRKRIPRFYSCINRLNSRRIGRSRRGSLQMVGVAGSTTAEHPDTFTVDVTLRRSRSRAAKFHLHDDIGKVLKDLTVAASRYRKELKQ
jgi:hypothetical protein